MRCFSCSVPVVICCSGVELCACANVTVRSGPMTRGTPEQHHRANNEIYIGLRNIQDASSLGLLAFEHPRKIRFCFTEQDEVGTSLPFDNWDQLLRGIEIHTMLEKWKSTI